MSTIHLQLFCDDSKATEIELINQGVQYAVGSLPGPRGELVDVLSVASQSVTLRETVTVHLTILDHDDLRGGLKPDTRGRSQRGDLQALKRLMISDGAKT